jgi:hypothetical protein
VCIVGGSFCVYFGRQLLCVLWEAASVCIVEGSFCVYCGRQLLCVLCAAASVGILCEGPWQCDKKNPDFKVIRIPQILQKVEN